MHRGFIVAVAIALLIVAPQMALTAPSPRPGGVLVFATEADPDRLDPNLSGLRTAQIVFFQIFDPLIVRDPADNTFRPWLAQSWEVSADGKAYTFRLRRDVKFHDGTPFGAEAVKFNMDRTHDPALSTPRVHSELGRTIYAEPGFAGRVADELARRGYEIVLTHYMGCNQAVGYGAEGIEAGSDPRGDKGIATYEVR